MRFSIRSLMLATLLVAIAWLPTVTLMGWFTNANRFELFKTGFTRSYHLITLRDLRELRTEWDRVIVGDYIKDYVSGHIFGWTTIALWLCAIALLTKFWILQITETEGWIRLRTRLLSRHRNRRSRRSSRNWKRRYVLTSIISRVPSVGCTFGSQ